MQKPSVYSVNLMYLEEKGLYAIYFTIKTTNKLEYITIDTGRNYDRMLKYAEELATLIETEFVNEFKVLINK